MNGINSRVVGYITSSDKWQEELQQLRSIILDCGLVEDFKWGKPVFLLDEKPVAIIYGFKEYCALGFFKGVLLSDPKSILVAPGEHSQTVRQLRFSSLTEIHNMESVVMEYIKQAVEVEKAGPEVKQADPSDLKLPLELQEKLDKDPDLKKAFHALTPGRQRGYVIYFSTPKQSKTRKDRIEKFEGKILAAKGLND